MSNLAPTDPRGQPGWCPNPNGHGKEEFEMADRPVTLDALFGATGPKAGQVRKFEQDWHRVAAYMLAAGRSPQEVACACDKGVDSVYAVQRNEWFQQTVLQIQREHGLDDLMAMFRGEVFNSFNTLVEIRDSKQAPFAVRRASAMDILERVMGKPQQNVVVDTTVRSADPVAEAEQLEKEVALLRLGTESPVSASSSDSLPEPAQRAAQQ